MKTFKEFVFEKTLSRSEAIDIMGLSGDFTEDDVKKRYKELAIANHPDKGGDAEEMKNINNAYEVLKGSSGSGLSSSKFDWDKLHKEYVELANRIVGIIKEGFNPAVFTEYFEKVFGKPFKLESIKYIGENHTGYGSPYVAGVTVNFDSVDGEMSFNIEASVTLSAVKNSTGLPSKGMTLPLRAYSTGFFNGRKFKLFNSTWKSFNLDAKSLNKPEEFFPEVKLKKHLVKKTKATRKDFINAITKIAKGERLNTDWYTLPYKDMDDSKLLTISRMTFMRQGLYDFKFYNKSGKWKYELINDKVFGDSWYISLPETQEVLDIILNIRKMNYKDVIKKLKDLHKDVMKK